MANNHICGQPIKPAAIQSTHQNRKHEFMLQCASSLVLVRVLGFGHPAPKTGWLYFLDYGRILIENGCQMVYDHTILNDLRLNAKITLCQLSQLTGLSISILSRYELNQRTPTVTSLAKIATALKQPMTVFFTEDAELKNDGNKKNKNETGKRIIMELSALSEKYEGSGNRKESILQHMASEDIEDFFKYVFSYGKISVESGRRMVYDHTILKDLRLNANFTLCQLSQLTGLSITVLSHYEHNLRTPTVTSLAKLAAALKQPLTVFFIEDAELNKSGKTQILKNQKKVNKKKYAEIQP